MLEARRVIPLFLVLLASCAGCIRDSGLVPVEGVITLDGQPMPGVHVLFDQPELPPNENKGYVGTTDERGRYTLRPALDEGIGAPPGDYRVSLTTAIVDPSAPAPQPTGSSGPFHPESPPPPPERIPPAYRDGKLALTVSIPGTDTANFELRSGR